MYLFTRMVRYLLRRRRSSLLHEIMTTLFRGALLLESVINFSFSGK